MSDWVNYQELAARLNLTESDVQSLMDNQKLAVQDNTPASDSPVPVAESTAKFLQENNVTLYHADFITSGILPDESVDLIVTSPPYNVGIEYQTHDDTREY